MLGHSIDCSFGRSGMDLHVTALVVEGGTNIDNIAGLLGSEGLFIDNLAHVEGAMGIDFHHGFESIRGQVVEVSKEITGSAVDKDINLFEFFEDLFDYFFDDGNISDIARVAVS